jgi:acyl-coenzyme A synthetase/AMP-(fatty) acid ligase
MGGGYIIVQGRADDTMNLGGIKVSLFQGESRIRKLL